MNRRVVERRAQQHRANDALTAHTNDTQHGDFSPCRHKKPAPRVEKCCFSWKRRDTVRMTVPEPGTQALFRRYSLGITRQTMLRVAGLMVMALAHATIKSGQCHSANGRVAAALRSYTLGGICLSALGRCTQNAMVSDFALLTRTVVGGDQLVEVSANYSADIFTDVGGAPGAFLGHLSLAGTGSSGT